MSNVAFKAAFYRGNHAFEIKEVFTSLPQANEVQIEVFYCGICGTDMHAFHGSMDARIGHNRIIGHEMSGKIVALGEGVRSFNIGEHVVVRPLVHCGECPACKAGHTHICHHLKFLGLDSDGAFQQRWNVPAHTVHIIPKSLPLDHAALIEPVAVACHCVGRSRLQSKEDVLVIGGGPIGILIAMVAKESGGRVIVSEVNDARLAVAKKLGMETLNPVKEDVGATIMDLTAQKGADVIFEVSGTSSGVDAMTKCAATRARIVMVAIHTQKPAIDLFQFFWKEVELYGSRVYRSEDYEKAIELVSHGKIDAQTIITDKSDLEHIQQSFEKLAHNPTAIKSLISIS